MRAFSFRLEHARRWRETEVRLQESRVAEASAKVGGIRAAIEARRGELAAARVNGNADGADLRAYADFRQRTEARIRDLEGQAVVAQRAAASDRIRIRRV